MPALSAPGDGPQHGRWRARRHVGYEDCGLLHPGRAANGYRDYTAEDVRLAEEIRSLGALGLTPMETRPFLACLRAATQCSRSAVGPRRPGPRQGVRTRTTPCELP
ncbi:MerR family transcriptional regulator [Streptomyces pharetrae]|uniref:MerR family transcriptional regulator n=1 Tax=Streptomyces pharetrae TaxID=291370 RepID=UPI00365748FB